MTAGCARCGSCCDPVVFDDETYRALATWTAEALRDVPDPAADDGWPWWQEHGWEDRELAEAWYDPEGTGRANADFITEHWHPLGDGDYRCDRFDPDHRTCTAHGDRPPVCSRYPWYDREPSGSDTGPPPQCSYLADLPAGERPEGSRPLIPLAVLRG